MLGVCTEGSRQGFAEGGSHRGFAPGFVLGFASGIRAGACAGGFGSQIERRLNVLIPARHVLAGIEIFVFSKAAGHLAAASLLIVHLRTPLLMQSLVLLHRPRGLHACLHT